MFQEINQDQLENHHCTMHYHREAALIKCLLIKCAPPPPHVRDTWLGVWSRDDEWWNDKVGPWDISSQREACSWRCRDTAAFQRESGDVREAITAPRRRSARRYQSGERREPLSLLRHLSAQQYLRGLTHLWHPLSHSSSFSSRHLCAWTDGAATEQRTARPVNADGPAKANSLVCLCSISTQPEHLCPLLHNLAHVRETARLHSPLWNDSHKNNVLCPRRNLMPHTIRATGKRLSCAI